MGCGASHVLEQTGDSDRKHDKTVSTPRGSAANWTFVVASETQSELPPEAAFVSMACDLIESAATQPLLPAFLHQAERALRDASAPENTVAAFTRILAKDEFRPIATHP